MKIKRGVNPDFADFDEIDVDVEDAYEEFEAGTLSFDDFREQVGPEAAQAFMERLEGRDEYDLFDDPENF